MGDLLKTLSAVGTGLFLVAIVGAVAFAILATALGFVGVSDQRAESQYTGHVVDVVENKGIVFRPTWVNMKTNPRSSDIQQYCIHPSDEATMVDRFYAAMEDGNRVTVTYSRPLWVPPTDCPPDTSIIRDIAPANASGGDE